MSRPVRFLEGDGPDSAGRMVGEVLGFDDEALERRHDFIQWLFPLPEPSQAVPESPVLTPLEVEALRASAPAQQSLASARQLMGDFYARTSGWLAPMDHNHLRITRIIRSLRLLAGDPAADAFRTEVLHRVEAANAPVDARARRFWMEA